MKGIVIEPVIQADHRNSEEVEQVILNHMISIEGRIDRVESKLSKLDDLEASVKQILAQLSNRGSQMENNGGSDRYAAGTSFDPGIALAEDAGTSTSLSDTYLSRLLAPPPATTPFSSYLSQHLPDGVSKLNLEAVQKVKLDQSCEQQRKQDEAELYKQMRLSEAIKELRGEEGPGKVRKPKANTKKLKKETVPIEPIEPIEPLTWLDLSLCTAPVSFFSSQKKRPRKTVSAYEPPLESEATVASPPLESEGSAAEVEASSKVTVASSPLKSEETVASLKSEATVASPPLESDATVASTSITEKTLSKRVEAIQEELVTEKTLSQEVAKYMRLFQEFRILRLEQIDMEDPEDKEKQKEEVESWQRDVVTSAIEVMTDAKKGRRPLVKLLHVVKEAIKISENNISCVKDEIETAKNKLDEDAREKEK